MDLPDAIQKYIDDKPNWHDSLMLLREIILSTNVEETVRWGAPAYVHDGENIIGLAAFKSYVGIWFHQGVFLKDELKLLHNANETKTKGMRQWRFADYNDIMLQAQEIESYVLEAIENQKAGLKIKVTRKKSLRISPELNEELTKSSSFKKAFEDLTKAKQIEFADYISEAKQSKTKQTRLRKIVPMIINGEGLHDKYRSKAKQ